MVSAGRAIRRFSAISVGPKKPPQMRTSSPSPFLSIPTLIPSITEEEEEEEHHSYGDNSVTIVPLTGPTISITADDDFSSNSGFNTPNHLDTNGPPVEPFEDTDSADGLRSYLQRMIDAGHLPGTRGSISEEGFSEESANEEE